MRSLVKTSAPCIINCPIMSHISCTCIYTNWAHCQIAVWNPPKVPRSPQVCLTMPWKTISRKTMDKRVQMTIIPVLSTSGRLDKYWLYLSEQLARSGVPRSLSWISLPCKESILWPLKTPNQNEGALPTRYADSFSPIYFHWFSYSWTLPYWPLYMTVSHLCISTDSHTAEPCPTGHCTNCHSDTFNSSRDWTCASWPSTCTWSSVWFSSRNPTFHQYRTIRQCHFFR